MESMRLPSPRGPVSDALVAALTTGDEISADTLLLTRRAIASCADVPADEDLQLALYTCYELHYRGFDGVADDREWDPSVLRLRGLLEAAFERSLHDAGAVHRDPNENVSDGVRRLVEGDSGPSLSRFVARRATLEQFREFALHRSLYQLKEADPHTWGIPRLTGRAKAALVEIQYDEYGGGVAARMHAALFARTLLALGLDDAYGAYLDVVPASTLATVNVISLFGLHRRLRGALVGHLAAFEMTSSIPNRRYADGLRRLGLGRRATEFYEERVEADAVHEQVAVVDLCGSLVAAEPDLHDAVLFGAASCLALENRFAAHLLECWSAGRTSLREERSPVGAR
jgi:hypothetical protein